jgi:hypothetical protein
MAGVVARRSYVSVQIFGKRSDVDPLFTETHLV